MKKRTEKLTPGRGQGVGSCEKMDELYRTTYKYAGILIMPDLEWESKQVARATHSLGRYLTSFSLDVCTGPRYKAITLIAWTISPQLEA